MPKNTLSKPLRNDRPHYLAKTGDCPFPGEPGQGQTYALLFRFLCGSTERGDTLSNALLLGPVPAVSAIRLAYGIVAVLL